MDKLLFHIESEKKSLWETHYKHHEDSRVMFQNMFGMVPTRRGRSRPRSRLRGRPAEEKTPDTEEPDVTPLQNYTINHITRHRGPKIQDKIEIFIDMNPNLLFVKNNNQINLNPNPDNWYKIWNVMNDFGFLKTLGEYEKQGRQGLIRLVDFLDQAQLAALNNNKYTMQNVQARWQQEKWGDYIISDIGGAIAILKEFVYDIIKEEYEFRYNAYNLVYDAIKNFVQ